MSRYLLLMRGDQAEFVNKSEEEQKTIIAEYVEFAEKLNADNKMVFGDGCSYDSVLLKAENGQVSDRQLPYVNSDQQLSGFYIIEAESDQEAYELAKDCPALKHGESVEVIRLGH